MDVLCCLIEGDKTIKEIRKRLKQPQSTISEKMGFLVKESIVKKTKWKFEVNWDKIIEVSRKEIKKFFDFFLIPPIELSPTKKQVESSKKEIEKFMKFFDDKKIRLILETYSFEFLEGYFEKKSITDIMMIYFDGLTQVDCEELKKMDPVLTKLKKRLGMSSMEKSLFLEVES